MHALPNGCPSSDAYLSIYLCLCLSRHHTGAPMLPPVHKHDHPVHISNRTYLRDSLLREPSRRRPMAHGKPVFRRSNPSCSELLGITPLWAGFEVVLHHHSRFRNLEDFVRQCTLPSSPWPISHCLFRARIRSVGAIGPVMDDTGSTNRIMRQRPLRWICRR
jgi:hypothetical protein